MSTEVSIERLGHLGDGVAAGPIFAPAALPGETVRGTLVGDRLTDVKIISPSPDRVRPPCRHARVCGGCQMQHASETLVAEWKRSIVAQAFKSQKIAIDIGAIHTSPLQSRRRAVLHAQRTKSGSITGFFGKSSQMLVPIEDCKVLSPDIFNAREHLGQLARIGASRKSTLDIVVTSSNAGLDVSVKGGKDLNDKSFSDAVAVASEAGFSRLSWNSELVVMRAPPTQRFGPATVLPPAGAFLQATKEGEGVLVSIVLDIVEGAKSVVDLFSGCGTFALPLAERMRVHAVEGDADLVAAAEAGWRGVGGLHAFSGEARDLFRRPLTPIELDDFQAAVLDPPRAGAEAQVTEISRSGLRKIAYVSCNPKSFARDAAILISAGFTAKTVTLVDQFSWTPHVELVCEFSRD